MAPKCMVTMTLNFFFIEFLDHFMYSLDTKAFEKVWYAWESKAWSCLVDLPPVAMECGFMRMLRSSGDLETFFFGIWQICAIFFYGKSFV
jgi:hypothetical protein